MGHKVCLEDEDAPGGSGGSGHCVDDEGADGAALSVMDAFGSDHLSVP